MSSITYTNQFLSQASDASQMDNDIRDWAQDTALGMSTSFRWPGSGGGSEASIGEMLPGTARLASDLTNPTASGLTRMFQGGAPNGSLGWMQRRVGHINPGGYLVHHGSENTMVLGGSKMEIQGAAPVSAVPYTARHVVQTGEVDVLINDSAATSAAVTFPIPFNETPFIRIAVSNDWVHTTGVFAITGVSNASAGGFISQISTKGTPSFPEDKYVTSLQWYAEGTVDYS